MEHPQIIDFAGAVWHFAGWRSEFDDDDRLPAYRCSSRHNDEVIVRRTPRATRYLLFSDGDLTRGKLELADGEWYDREYTGGEVHGIQSTFDPRGIETT